MGFFTGKGDSGQTSLPGNNRLPKSDPIFDLLGILDEATAYLGLAISLSSNPCIIADMRTIQDDLSKFMGTIAGVEKTTSGVHFDTQERITWLEERISYYASNLDTPHAFVYPGVTASGAATDISRTIVRKAERLYVRIYNENKAMFAGIAFLNRLSSLLFVMRLFIDNQAKTSA